jgi:hypothetical protein
MSRRPQRRTQSGQGIVEAAIGILIIVILVTGGSMLVMNSAVMAYYQLKLQSVAIAAAQFASSLPANTSQEEINQRTQDTISQIAPRVFPRVNPPVQVRLAGDVSRQPEGSVVTVTGVGLPLLAGVPFLPTRINLIDTEVSILQAQRPGYVWLDYLAVNSAPPGPAPADPAYLPVLNGRQIDDSKGKLMLDTFKWPASHVIAHDLFNNPSETPRAVFPEYRGYRGEIETSGSPGAVTRDQVIEFLKNMRKKQLAGQLADPYPRSARCAEQPTCMDPNRPFLRW